MKIETKYYTTRKSARYSTFGKLSPSTQYLWFVLHGSQMTCEQMIYKFSEFDPETHFIVAPEGLNRSYHNGFSGEVVASWMTKRDRLEEINDFSAYLSGLYQSHIDLLPPTCKKTILGFSQGGTTMYRWLHKKKVPVDYMIPYSCWIPEDIDLTLSETPLNTITAIYTYGLQDQYLNEETLKKVMEVVDKNRLDLSFEQYDGDHRIDRQQIKKLFHTYVEY